MDITFTIKITEKQIPEMIGLLAKMWDNPDPTANFEIIPEAGQKTVYVMKESKTSANAPAEAHMAATPAAPAAPAETAELLSPVFPGSAPAAQTAPTPEAAIPPTAPPAPTAAQIQAAAGAFMAQAPNNITILQELMREMGVTAFPQLSNAQLATFAQKLRDLGVAV